MVPPILSPLLCLGFGGCVCEMPGGVIVSHLCQRLMNKTLAKKADISGSSVGRARDCYISMGILRPGVRSSSGEFPFALRGITAISFAPGHLLGRIRCRSCSGGNAVRPFAKEPRASKVGHSARVGPNFGQSGQLRRCTAAPKETKTYNQSPRAMGENHWTGMGPKIPI